MTKKWLNKWQKNDKKMTPQNRNDKKCKTKWQKNDKKMTKINNQQPSEFAGKIFIKLLFQWVNSAASPAVIMNPTGSSSSTFIR